MLVHHRRLCVGMPHRTHDEELIPCSLHHRCRERMAGAVKDDARAHLSGMLLQDLLDVLGSATVGEIAVCHAIALRRVFNPMQDQLARIGPVSGRSLWRP